MTTEQLAKEIFQRYGAVSRTKNSFIYTKKSIRLTDMFLENGRAILGWQCDSAFTQFKNTLNRGQVGSFICEQNSLPRLNKALSKLLDSDREIFSFSCKQDALKASLLFSKSNSSLYFPWSPQKTNWSQIDSVIISPPLPWTDSLYLVAVKSQLLKENPDLDKIIPATTTIPFALQVAITRSIYNLIKAIESRQEKDWFIYDQILNKYWIRKGPYLYPKMSEDDYNSFILHCLDCEIIINPCYNNPSIIPFGADKGVFTKLKNNPFEFREI